MYVEDEVRRGTRELPLRAAPARRTTLPIRAVMVLPKRRMTEILQRRVRALKPRPRSRLQFLRNFHQYTMQFHQLWTFVIRRGRMMWQDQDPHPHKIRFKIRTGQKSITKMIRWIQLF